MFKLSVPAVCSPNGFPNVHTTHSDSAIRCFDPCACSRRISTQSTQFYFYPQNKSEQRPTSSDVTILKPSFLHVVSLHLSPLPYAEIHLQCRNGGQRTNRQQNKTNTFGCITNNRKRCAQQIPLATEPRFALCQHRHQTNNITNRVNRFWLLWHFSEDRKTNFPISSFEQIASRTNQSNYGRQRNWVAWQSGFCRHQINWNPYVVIAVSNGFDFW